MRKYLVFALFLSINTFSNAQTFEAKVDSLISSVFKDETGPGGTFLIAKDGKPVYQKSFAKANVELDVNLNNESIFQLGSITKQFTAIAILMLAEQGKLNLRAPIKNYIPDYPNGENITVHHLLTHTSGIKDFTKMKTLPQIAQKDLEPKDVINFFKNETADFLPGEKFEYNNSGYVVLGYLIELTSQETYENYIKKHIFDKLGMKNSRYASDRSIIKNRAYGYQQKNNIYFNKSVISFNIPYASGSLMSTVGDMLIWQNALTDNLLLKASTIQKAFTSYKL
ncbi:MAG: class A beta-lactamase-related serine hydrolase, partial [Pedobacter sp.]